MPDPINTDLAVAFAAVAGLDPTDLKEQIRRQQASDDDPAKLRERITVLEAQLAAGKGTINYGPNEFPKADPSSLAIKGGTASTELLTARITVQELTPDEWRFTLRIIL